jgi:uncharacterized protein YneR
MTNPPQETLSQRAKRLSEKHNLLQGGFDSECINQKGDLTKVISQTLSELLPEEKFTISETVSKDGRQYIADVKHSSGTTIQLFADTYADYLPEGFSMLLESIPVKIGSQKRFYMMNPRLMGQEVWYFSGDQTQIEQARKEGLPLITSGEDFMEMDISEFE